jgi:hypothetical protein
MTALEFSVVFSVGLAGGLHCMQMCGPVVLAYSLPLRASKLAAHIAYNGGRIATYMLLGALAGGIGQGIGLAGRLAGVASAARIVAGVAMIVTGILVARILPGGDLVRIEQRGITARFSGAIARFITAPRVVTKFSLGLMLGFLPCGLIYAALLKAMESAGPIPGALTMLAFGLGTAVALFGVGLGSSLLGAHLGRWANRLVPVSMIVFGAILLWRGLLAKPVCHG